MPNGKAVVTGLVTNRRGVGARSNPPTRAGPCLADPSAEAERRKDLAYQTRAVRASHCEARGCLLGVVR